MHQSKGFSLIELMITVAIVGILAAVAVPSYQSYVLKANRYAAISDLLTLQLSEEKYYAEHHSYTDSFADLGLAMSRDQYWYYITLYSHSEYEAQAEPFTSSRQWEDQKEGIDCSVLAFDHRGSKLPAICWER
jgi:type IV pilus assembly protein PilE